MSGNLVCGKFGGRGCDAGGAGELVAIFQNCKYAVTDDYLEMGDYPPELSILSH